MRGLVALSLLAVPVAPAAAADPTPLDPALRQRCEQILRDGLKSDEFWPAMHAAEALTPEWLRPHTPALPGASSQSALAVRLVNVRLFAQSDTW